MRVANQRQDSRTWNRNWAQVEETRSWLGVPLYSKNKVIGMLTLTRASLVFGKRGKTSFAVGGTLSGSPSAVDPAAGVTFTVATPRENG